MKSDSDDPESDGQSEREPVPAIEEAATGTAEQPDVGDEVASHLRPARRLAAIVVVLGLV